VLVLLVVAFYREALAGLRVPDDRALLVVGSIAGFTSLLLTFQTTSGFWFAYPWIVAAIGVAASRTPKEAG
jgi:hypothetical protein